jgi:hypothetical protein
MTDASLEYLQLLAQSEILQGDLFITRKYPEDRPKDNQDFVQHSDQECCRPSLMKINRLRDRCDFGQTLAS